jgi:hypothetical protein
MKLLNLEKKLYFFYAKNKTTNTLLNNFFNDYWTNYKNQNTPLHFFIQFKGKIIILQ